MRQKREEARKRKEEEHRGKPEKRRKTDIREYMRKEDSGGL